MLWAVLLLVPVSFGVSLIGTFAARGVGRRLNALDSGGVAGQVKDSARAVPNTGGVGVFLGVVVPMVAGLLLVWLMPGSVERAAGEHLDGVRGQSVDALILLCTLLAVHVMGVYDDRRPMGPWVKLGVMIAAAGVLVVGTDSRLLELLDDAVPGGRWVSVVLSVVWIVAVTNAFNFMDNMDGLCAGVAAIAGVFFLAAMAINEKWFVAATLAVLVGSLCGFLVFNFPWRTGKGGAGGREGGASIFLGDGGSLVVGLLLGFLTVRATYADVPTVGAGDVEVGLLSGGAWYAIFMPVVVLAVPMYDMASVVWIRLRQGKSPFVGDLQHFSHRLVRRGLSKRAAVLVIYGCTAVTSIGGVSLGSLEPWQAVLVGVQTLLVLGVIAMFEWRANGGVGVGGGGVGGGAGTGGG